MSAQIKLMALDVADAIWGAAKAGGETALQGAQWVGGALQGEFNTRATVGQIVVDAVISMFPIAGEATAARDATAIILRMCDEPKAAQDKWQWVALILCLLAVIPVLGGVLKGVGRLIIRAANKGEDLAKLAQQIISFLHKMGYGDARKFLKELDFAKYQSAVISAFHAAISRIAQACIFVVKHMGAVLPANVKTYLDSLPTKIEWLRQTGDRMIPEAVKELNAQLNKVREKMVEGSYIAPIRVGPHQTTVMIQEGRILEEKVIHGSMQHPSATLANYRRKRGWPDLQKKGEIALKEDTSLKREFKDIRSAAGDFWPINTFSRNAPIVAHLGKPGEPLVRILDKTVANVRGGNGAKAPKYTQDFHKAGDMWTDSLPPNGLWFRIKLAVMHKWNANGYYEKLNIPTRAQMETLGIQVPHDWDGMKLWKGTVGGQLDIEKARNGLEASGHWLEGGGTQFYIDFSHPHNAPVKEYLLKTVKVMETGWKDLQLAVGKDVHRVVNLEAMERSAKIQQQGYVLRGAAVAGKQGNNTSTEGQ